jgi:hypothetical protein
MRRASDLWNEGEKALAHIHLTYADLPIYGEDEMLRLFLARNVFPFENSRIIMILH